MKQQTAPGNISFSVIREPSVCARLPGGRHIHSKRKNTLCVCVRFCVAVKVICDISSHSKIDWQDKQPGKNLQTEATKRVGREERWRGSVTIKDLTFFFQSLSCSLGIFCPRLEREGFVFICYCRWEQWKIKSKNKEGSSYVRKHM